MPKRTFMGYSPLDTRSFMSDIAYMKTKQTIPFTSAEYSAMRARKGQKAAAARQRKERKIRVALAKILLKKA